MRPKIQCDGQKPKNFGTKRALTQKTTLFSLFSQLEQRFSLTRNQPEQCFQPQFSKPNGANVNVETIG